MSGKKKVKKMLKPDPRAKKAVPVEGQLGGSAGGGTINNVNPFKMKKGGGPQGKNSW